MPEDKKIVVLDDEVGLVDSTVALEQIRQALKAMGKQPLAVHVLGPIDHSVKPLANGREVGVDIGLVGAADSKTFPDERPVHVPLVMDQKTARVLMGILQEQIK